MKIGKKGLEIFNGKNQQPPPLPSPQPTLSFFASLFYKKRKRTNKHLYAI
jgi:hypothetical protein